MFRRATLKNFLYCILLTTIVSTTLCVIVHFKFSLPTFGLSLLCNSVNIILVVCLFRNQFLEENEERERHLKHQIECSSAHLTSIINNLPLIALVIDPNYRFITGNTEALKFFDITEHKQFGKLSLNVFERDTMELIKEENDLIIKNKKTFVSEKLVKLKNGKQQWCRIRKVPILDKRQDVKGFVVFGRNIDSEKAAQKQRET